MENKDNYGYTTMDNGFIGKFGYRGSSQFAPLSAWGYFGYSVLFCIPIVGIICMIVFSISDANINRRSFARSFWIPYIIFGILLLASLLLGGTAALTSYMRP